MSELEKLLKPEPEFLPLEDWRRDNDTGDEINNRKEYANYVRSQYVDAGMYDDRIANEINMSTYEGALADGVLTEEDEEKKIALLVPDEPDLDTQLQQIQKNLDYDTPAWQAATKYLNFKKVNPEGADVPEEIRLKGEQYFADAQAVAATEYNTALRNAVRSGELPLAKVKNEDGDYEILVSPSFGSMSVGEAIRASKKGGISFADATAVQSKLSTPIGYNEPMYKIERYMQAASAIEEFSKKDAHLSKIIDRYTESLVAADKDGRTPKELDEHASMISWQINKSGILPNKEAVTNEEVSKALTQIVYNNANSSGQFKFYDAPEEAYKNVRNVGFGTAFVHPSAMLNDDSFKNSVLNNPNLTEDQKKTLEAQREPMLQQQFDYRNKLLSESSLSDEWLSALQAGRVNKKKDTVILREFLSNPDNFSEIKDRLSGIGSSIVDGFGEMVAAVPMMMGADWARDYMIGNLKERSDRREVARMFNVEYGVGQDFAETLAPMLVDMAATTILAGATMPAGGTGGALYLSAKQGARLTAKGMLKAMTTNALRQLPTETAEQAAERLVAQNLIKASSKEVGIKGAQAAIKGFNNQLVKQVGLAPAIALPAFNRSAGSTYASVYAAIDNDPNLTEEQKHDRALGAALASGTITAAITVGFSAFGRSGIENALLGGASRKQIKNIMARLANVDDIPDEVFNKVISKQIAETLKKQASFGVGKEILKNSLDEGMEEGLDTFINGFVTDAATDQDTPFIERLIQTGNSALIGGMAGAGVPAVQAAKSAVMQRGDVGSQMAVEIEFAKGVSQKLTEAGSPLTAQTVYSILTAPRRTRAPIAQSILEASRQQAAETATEVAAELPEVKDATEPDTALTPERLTEALNNVVSPDTVAKVIVDERGQTQFDFVEDIPLNEVAKRGRTVRKPTGTTDPVIQQLEFDFTAKQENKVQDQLDLGLDVPAADAPKVKVKRSATVNKSIKKANLAEQLGLNFDKEAADEQNNHIDANYSDEDLTEQEQQDIQDELQEELAATQQPQVTKAKGKKAVGVPAQATAAPAKPAAKAPKVQPIAKLPVSEEPMFATDEFIDDELIGQEVAALTKVATFGYPVRLERKALHGMPQRGKYPKGYLAGKSDMVARKVNELYPVSMPTDVIAVDTITGKDKVSYYDPQAKKVVRKAPKAFVDENGVGIFNNDPVSMKLLLDRHIPVVVPDNFTGTLNPSFRMYTSGGRTFLNDIVMTNPESGTGFVSVLTKQDKVISSEPNYKYYENLSTFTALFNEGVAERTVPDPKGKAADVTIASIIQDADQLYSAASTNRPNSAYGDPAKAQATLRSILKPRQGTLEREFFEGAVPAFAMAVRKEAYLHELRLGMDKFSERKSGEATPTLKTDKINQAVTDFVSRTKVDKVTAAKNIAKVFGSDINPDAQPELVIQKFIEDVVLTRRPNMPTYREIGAKVGNAFAEQQRSRDIFARKALFQTTDPADFAQIVDDTELFDPEAEAADNTFIAPTEPFEAPDSGLISKVLEKVAFDAADALDTDPEMRAVIDKMLRRTVFKGNSAIDVTKLPSTDAFGMLASWMASGNYNTNPDAIKFQQDLLDGVYENSKRLRRPLKLMYLSSKTIEGDPTKDDAYVDSIRENLADSFGRPVSKQEASAFIKSIGGAVQKLWSRSYVRGEQIIFARQQNDAAVERLGLKTNDPESVINAFKVIASTDADPNKRLLAKLLLENQGYIRQVEFSLDESPLEYSGGFIKASNGQPMISINLDGHNGRGLADVLLHEYTHAFVSISAASPNENLNAAQRGSLQRLNGILELARRSAADSNITDPVLLDGLENINEFVAHFFTSTDFQGYLKTLLPPTKQRGFFARMVDAVLDMFGLNRSKQANYQQAFADMVDLTRAAVLRAPLTPKGLINRLANPASRTLNQVSEAARAIRQTLATSVEQPTQYEVYDRQTGEVVWTGTRRDIARQVQDNRDNEYGGYRFAVRQTAATATTPAPETLAAAIDQETEDLVSGITEQDVVSGIYTSDVEISKIKDMIRMVRRMVPAEFALEINTDMPYAAAFQGGKILLNPYAMSGVVAGLDSTSARGIVEGIMTEEAAHAASYNALTQQELDNYVATLKESDFDAIIDSYYQTEEKRAEAKARIRSEDPVEAAREREGMAEEKLRMHSQKVTRGFTTEEDYMFWRGKPSLFQILGRYMKGFINRYMAGKSIATMNGAQRAALQRMITEVRAINAGYRITPNTLEFDAQNPHATLSQIATQIASAPLELTKGQIVATQFGSGTMEGIDADAVKADTVAGYEVGTRSPTTKGFKNTGFDPSMQVDLKTMRTNPEVYRKNAVLLVSYPIVARELRDGGNGAIVDRIRSLDKEAIKIDADIEAQKELLVEKDKEVKTAVAEVLGKRKTKLRAFDIRSTIESQMKLFEKELEAKPKTKAKGFAKVILEKEAIEDKIKELQKDRKSAAEKAKKALNEIALDDQQFSIEDADAVYNSMIAATESNLSSLIELFPKDIRHLAKLWYDGANRIAQRLSRASKKTVEQAAGVLAVFSPQKDWYMNVSLAERMMKFWTGNQDAVFDEKMVDRFMMRSGEPQITGEDENGNPIYQGKAVPELDSSGQPIIDPVTGRQKFINWDAESMEKNLREASLFIEQVRGKKFSDITSIDVGRKKPLSKEAVQARFIRMFSEVYDDPYFPVVVPDGRTLGPSLSENGKPISIAWGGYNTIEKAIRIMRAEGSPQEISKLVSNELGEKHKVRSFFNNIVAPQSERGHVTMDTHAIAALLWRALSGASLEVTQNFGGAGTSSDGALGLSGLYAAFAEAYRKAASNFGLLPREAQSITWEAVRMLFPAKWKGDKKNVAKINQIWTDYENGKTNIEEARDLIFQLSPVSKGRTLAQAIADGGGVGRPDWSGIQRGDYDSGTVQGTDDEGQIPVRGGLRDVPLIDRGFTGAVGGIARMVSGTAGQRARVLASQVGTIGVPPQLADDASYDLIMSKYNEGWSSITTTAKGRTFSPIVRDLLQRRKNGETIPKAVMARAIDEHFQSKKVDVQKSIDELPSQERILEVITSDKLRKHIRSMEEGLPEEGDPVELRQDVPAMTDHNTGVVTTTYKKNNNSLGVYLSAARITNPTFDVSKTEKLSEKIGLGEGKGPHITIKGKWKEDQSIPEDLESWTQVGFNPDRHSYYYERGTSRMVVSGEEAFQIGNTVFVKNPKFGDPLDKNYPIRYTQFGTASQLDADYMKAVDAGDTAEMQRLVDQAAKAAGYTQEGWHGSTSADSFTIFRTDNTPDTGWRGLGAYFGSSDQAGGFGKNLRRFYLKLNNTLETDFGALMDRFDDPIVARQILEAEGYDSVMSDPYAGAIAVFKPEQIKSADPITRDNNGNVIPLSQRFQTTSPDIRYTQFGAASQLPAGFDADAIDYSNFLESLEMPLMEVGTYQSPTKMMDKLLKGELDPRILRLKNQRDFFNKATFDLVKRYKTKLDAIIKRDFGGIESAPIDLIQAATGSTKGIVVPEDVITQIEEDFSDDLEMIDIDDTLTADDKMVARDIALANRNKAIADAEKAAADSIRTSRDQALADLAVDSPELVQHIVQLRTLTDELSKKVTELYGFPPELKAKFDNQLGIYLTRSYKMFDEVGYGERVLNDPDYDTVREAAINFFEQQFIDSEVSRRISGPNAVPRAQAEVEAKRELGLKTMGGRSYGQLMMEEFVRSYDKSGTAVSSASLSQSLKPLLDNIQLKRDIPKPIRDLLGEQGAEGGADNLLRSLVTVATMASNQSFLNHVRDVGRASGWLLSASELSEARKRDYDTYKDYKSVRESTTSSYDPLGELYGPPEMVEGFRKVFSPDGVRFNQTTAQELINGTMKVAAKMSGGAMAAKTLGSIGFYIRNIVSNSLFFAPAQGFVNFKSMAKSAYSEVFTNALRNPDAIDAYRTKLISLGIIGDDINTNIMASMLRGGTPDDIETQLDKLLDTASKGLKPLKWLSDRAQVLSASVDAFYKIAYYENELRVLKEARAVDTGSLASMSDQQLEFMARDKVLATAQSASQAPPIIREFSKSGLGLLLAPFIRFKAEVPRIVFNTYKTAWAEMNSSNPVLKSRGIKRFSGMSLMLGGISMITPAIISWVRGIGDDEDEALRDSIPEYLRNHTFFYRRKADGQLQSWDLTFLNPFSIVADPIMRSLDLLFKGRPADAAVKFLEVALFDQYLDDQILSSAVQNLRDNNNPTTNKPIYEPKIDGVGMSLVKAMGFVFKEAYQPSVMKRAIDSYRAIGADYTEFEDSPLGILVREIYPVKPHDIELDKQLRRYLFETRNVFNRVNERKNVLLGQKAMSADEVKEVIQSEIEDKAKINEDIYKKLRGFEGLGLTPQQLYQITTGAGYGKDRTRLLFNKIMDRPVLNPEFVKKLTDPENEQGLERLRAAAEVLQGTPRYILLEP